MGRLISAQFGGNMQFLTNVVETDNHELAVCIPDMLLENLGWFEGDEVVLSTNADGSITVSKVTTNE